ncbi:GNAT family N-acetyltransferase [Pokkaliibacter sp. MBI-7]|uniref:GNAT family N-acetyltransferase n=1 Tax=Pokkaliibacter sp. MBI-7 TaxID=3040600 RepID=UPI00244A6072|nr:GNAT family N-acetyltransferase [Pokkaliibacter sp. MBI-7]MDH2436153.1 GNAT family N-acetyltransferase [Pokkaliibacter sp. MBI-7]
MGMVRSSSPSMHDAPHDRTGSAKLPPLPLDLRAADDDDRQYAHDLTYNNMRRYYVQYGIEWSSKVYFQQWPSTANFILLDSTVTPAKTAGLLRLQIVKPWTYLWDLQIEPAYQRRGVGREALQRSMWLARHTGCSLFRLRVFKSNPALQLYLRYGLEIVRDEDSVYMMEKLLPAVVAEHADKDV